MFLFLIGLIALGFVTGVLSVPSIKDYNSRWGNISDNTTEIITIVTIENSNPFKVTVPIAKVDYILEMNNIKMAHGTFENINLKKGRSKVELISYFDNTKIPRWWVSHLKNNETTIVNIDPAVVINLGFSEPSINIDSKTKNIQTNILENVGDLDEKTIQLGLEYLIFNPDYIYWGNITNVTTEIVLDIMVTNPVNLSIILPEINYNITMNNILIGNGKVEDFFVLEAENDSKITIITSIDNDMLDDWFVSHLRNNEHSNLKIWINSAIKYNDIDYVIDDFLIYSHEFETDILGSSN